MRRKKLSQKDQIWNWLKRGHSITRQSAVELFRCYELPARICELRREGKEIVGEPAGKHFVYRLGITH